MTGLLLTVRTQQLVLRGGSPASGLLLLSLLVLRPGDGFSVQVFLRLRGNQFDRLGLRFRFDRPGFGDFEVLHISHLRSQAVRLLPSITSEVVDVG
jgi:hypothetical protein